MIGWCRYISWRSPAALSLPLSSCSQLRAVLECATAAAVVLPVKFLFVNIAYIKAKYSILLKQSSSCRGGKLFMLILFSPVYGQGG